MSLWGGSSSSPPAPSAGQSMNKDEIIKAIQQEVAQKKVAELVSLMQTVCFKRCVNQPSTSLSSTENACLSQCVQKYMGTLDVVSKQWNKSVSQMGNSLGSH